MSNEPSTSTDSKSTDATLSPEEKQRLQHLSEELDVEFDLNHMSVIEAKQLIGELEKRAAREAQQGDADV